MSKLNQPLRLWHGLLAIVAALAVGAAGTAIAGDHGGAGKDLTTAGFGPSGFVHVGKHYYGFKARNTPPGDSQTPLALKCPGGTKVIGGGGGGFSNVPGEQAINFIGPFDSRDRGRKPEDGWRVFVNNVGLEGGEGIEVSAVCLKKR